MTEPKPPTEKKLLPRGNKLSYRGRRTKTRRRGDGCTMPRSVLRAAKRGGDSNAEDEAVANRGRRTERPPTEGRPPADERSEQRTRRGGGTATPSPPGSRDGEDEPGDGGPRKGPASAPIRDLINPLRIIRRRLVEFTILRGFFVKKVAICFYTALLLRRCMDSNFLIKTYPDVGELAFGRKGRLIIATFMYLESATTWKNSSQTLPLIVLGTKFTGKCAFVLLGTAIVLSLTWLKSLGVLAYVSFGGVVASWTLLVCILWVGAIDGVGFHERGSLFRWSGVPTATFSATVVMQCTLQFIHP
ncbi:hypothetical protein Taro_020585 [Colocasia esculenta]|uniref:Amino acid transporter transmembrane domain-containing protein n=1 Tax=Colocasia esculenta TaxID=4460 RepID=A0A843UWP6_COLES|nr:hypothetical protein [Colocasia esculenta]